MSTYEQLPIPEVEVVAKEEVGDLISVSMMALSEYSQQQYKAMPKGFKAAFFRGFEREQARRRIEQARVCGIAYEVAFELVEADESLDRILAAHNFANTMTDSLIGLNKLNLAS